MKRTLQPLFGAKTTGDIHSDTVDLATPACCILSISLRSRSFCFGPARYRAKCMGDISIGFEHYAMAQNCSPTKMFVSHLLMFFINFVNAGFYFLKFSLKLTGSTQCCSCRAFSYFLVQWWSANTSSFNWWALLSWAPLVVLGFLSSDPGPNHIDGTAIYFATFIFFGSMFYDKEGMPTFCWMRFPARHLLCLVKKGLVVSRWGAREYPLVGYIQLKSRLSQVSRQSVQVLLIE